MAQATTERLPVAGLDDCAHGYLRRTCVRCLGFSPDDEDTTGLRVSIRAVLVCRASRAARLAQRARAAGNTKRARRLAVVARDWAGLPPIREGGATQ